MPVPIDTEAANSTTPSSLNPPAGATGDITNGTTEPPKTPSDLPPAALDLAAKLFDLARNGETDTLKAYMDAGVPTNLTNHSGDSLLMLASYHDHPATVTMLLSKRADPNVMNARGQAPVAGAAFKGHKEVVELLVRAGADVSLGQPNALDTARMFRREDLLEILRTGKGAENERAEGDRPWEGERASADLGEMRRNVEGQYGGGEQGNKGEGAE